MTEVELSLSVLLTALIASGLIGGLRLAAPKIHAAIPNVLWIPALIVLGRLGTWACQAVGAPCEGNPLAWTEPQVNDLAVALTAIALREGKRSLVHGTKTATEFATRKGWIPPRGGAP